MGSEMCIRDRPRTVLTGHAGRPTCTDLCTSAGTVGRSAGRPTGSEILALCIWAVDQAVDRSREVCFLYLGGRSCGRPDCPNGHISDRWRSAGRPTVSLSGCQISLTASFLFGLYKPHFFRILAKISRAKISLINKCFKQVFKIVFVPKNFIHFVLSVLFYLKEIRFWELFLS